MHMPFFFPLSLSLSPAGSITITTNSLNRRCIRDYLSSGNLYDGSQCPEKCSEEDRAAVQALFLSISERESDDSSNNSREVGTACRCRDPDSLNIVNEKLLLLFFLRSFCVYRYRFDYIYIYICTKRNKIRGRFENCF